MRFGLAGGIISLIFVLIVEIFLWIKYVPFYNSIMLNLYGVVGFNTFSLVKILSISLLSGFIVGFLLACLFARIYNVLLSIKVK